MGVRVWATLERRRRKGKGKGGGRRRNGVEESNLYIYLHADAYFHLVGARRSFSTRLLGTRLLLGRTLTEAHSHVPYFSYFFTNCGRSTLLSPPLLLSDSLVAGRSRWRQTSADPNELCGLLSNLILLL